MDEDKFNKNATTSLSHDEWAAKHPKVESWLKKRRPSRSVFLSIFRPWFEWLMEQGEELASLSPEELLKFQKRARGTDDEYLIVDKIEEYIKEHDDWRRGYKRKVFTTISSFFKLNRAALPQDPEITRNLRSEKPPVRKDLTLDHLKRVVLGKNIMYRAVFLSMVAGGMGMDEIVEWSDQGVDRLRRELEIDRRRKYGVIRIDLKPRKKNPRSYYTLLGGDALEALEDWLRYREGLRLKFERENPGEEYPRAIFVSMMNTPLTVDSIQAYWRRRVYALRIVKPRKKGGPGTRHGVNPHQIRSLFRTQFGQSPSDKGELHQNVAKFMMGHVVDPYDYNCFSKDEDLVISEYRKALPYLNILSSDRPFRKVDETEVESLRQRVNELEAQLSPENRLALIRELIDPKLIEKAMYEAAHAYVQSTGLTVETSISLPGEDEDEDVEHLDMRVDGDGKPLDERSRRNIIEYFKRKGESIPEDADVQLVIKKVEPPDEPSSEAFRVIATSTRTSVEERKEKG